MGVYVITDGCGSYIRKDEYSSKYVTIRSFKQAGKWDSAIKANSVLNNSVAKIIRSAYAVQLIDTEHTVEKKSVDVQKSICNQNIEDEQISDWLEKLNQIKNIISGADSRQEVLNERLSGLDKEISDINHYIEFGKFNAYQGYMCFKMLQNLFKQRRKVKNEQQVLTMIKQNRIGVDSITTLAQMIADVQNKCYTPRAIPELFKNGN